MLRIVEIAFAVLFGAAGFYFGFKGWATLFKNFVSYQTHVNYERQYFDEQVRNARVQAIYLSLSAVSFLVALALGLSEWAALLLIPVLVGTVWLQFLIQRWQILRWYRKRPE